MEMNAGEMIQTAMVSGIGLCGLVFIITWYRAHSGPSYGSVNRSVQRRTNELMAQEPGYVKTRKGWVYQGEGA